AIRIAIGRYRKTIVTAVQPPSSRSMVFIARRPSLAQRARTPRDRGLAKPSRAGEGGARRSEGVGVHFDDLPHLLRVAAGQHPRDREALVPRPGKGAAVALEQVVVVEGQR